MFPEYISTILWLFAVKCCKDRTNHFVHQANGCTPFKTLASHDSAPIKVSIFHTFGCPCYVLDRCLQLGTGKIPKWEPQSQMSRYIGRSSTHASWFDSESKNGTCVTTISGRLWQWLYNGPIFMRYCCPSTFGWIVWSLLSSWSLYRTTSGDMVITSKTCCGSRRLYLWHL